MDDEQKTALRLPVETGFFYQCEKCDEPAVPVASTDDGKPAKRGLCAEHGVN